MTFMPLPPLECRFGCGPAAVWLTTPAGCVCFPDDRAQALCAQHLYKDGLLSVDAR